MFVQSAYFIIPGISNHRRYQYEEGIVKDNPRSLVDLSNVERRVFIKAT
jgi:hypothetical protein